jgi:hypothetical protein
MGRRRVLVALGLANLALAVLGVACGSSAVGVDACKSIEEARCNELPDCPNVQVSPPIWYTTGTAVQACVRYYDTACAHGLSIGTTPSTTQVSDCVTAIKSSCAVVAEPQTDPNCAWLVPPAAEDAGDGGDGGDADASDGEGGE